MNRILKKVLRSAQVFVPSSLEAKFAVHGWYFRSTKLMYKRELNGLRALGLRDIDVVDVGGHRGQSIVAFKNAIPSVRIHSFEANRFLADKLASRYVDDPAVHVEACALAPTDGELTLYVPFYRKYMFDGLSSIWRHEAEDWLNEERLYFFDPTKVRIQESTMQARPLDSYDLSPQLIKMSVQRSEIGVLEGATKTIQKAQPIIISAYPWDDLVNHLKALGYREATFDGGGFRLGQRGGYFGWFFTDEHIAKYSKLGVTIKWTGM